MAVRSKLLYAFPAEGPPVVEDRAYRYLESTGRPSLDRELYDDELYLEAPEPEDVGPEVVAGPPDTPAPVPGVNDYEAWATLADSDFQEGQFENSPLGPRLMPSEEELPHLLRLVLNRDATPEETNLWRENMRDIMARGRSVNRSFPMTSMGDTPEGIANFFKAEDARRAREEAQFFPEYLYHERNPNPPFAGVRGGPTMAPPMSEDRPQDDLAAYLERMGVHPEIAETYRTHSVVFAPGSGFGSYGDRPRIELSGLLNSHYPEDVITKIAQHEGVHSYDTINDRIGGRALREMPAYDREALMQGLVPPDVAAYPGVLRTAQAAYPAAMRYLEAVPQSDPSYLAHTYTAPFDQGLTLEDLPPVLRRFFVDVQGRSLLNQNPVLLERWRAQEAARRAGVTR